MTKNEKDLGRVHGTQLARNIARQYGGRLERKIERKIEVGDFFDSEAYPALLLFLYDLDDDALEGTVFTAQQRDQFYQDYVQDGVTPSGFENLVDFAEQITEVMISAGLYSESESED